MPYSKRNGRRNRINPARIRRSLEDQARALGILFSDTWSNEALERNILKKETQAHD